ncbi:MAG: hypothetical protein IJ704_02480 [Bacilli bacterium]|nr:hypothetical protein [Bacilli bacterium]
MKKGFKFLGVLVLVGALFFAAGCEKKDMSRVVGTYEGQFTKFVGDPDEAKNTEDAFSIELKEDGTGIHHRDDLDLSITWTLDGENFTMKETFLKISIDYTGTLKDGKLDIFNGDPTNDVTCEYVYQKK